MQLDFYIYLDSELITDSGWLIADSEIQKFLKKLNDPVIIPNIDNEGIFDFSV